MAEAERILSRSKVILGFIRRWLVILVNLTGIFGGLALSKSVLCGRKHSVLMVAGLSFMVLYRWEEGPSLVHNVLIFDRYHLIKIDSLPLILHLWCLVLESGCSWAERLKMVSSAQLVVKHLQFVLDLGVVGTRTGVCFELLRYLIHKISLDWRVERVSHVRIWHSEARAYSLEDLLFGLLLNIIYLVKCRWGWFETSRISVRHTRHISPYKIVSRSIGAKLSEISSL